MNRAKHWMEAERLQAQGIAQVTELTRVREKHGLWQDTAAAQLEALASLYFRAAQVSATLAQAGPGVDAEVARLQKERPPMPPPPPRPTLAPVRDDASTRASDSPEHGHCFEQNRAARGDCEGQVIRRVLKAKQYGYPAGSSVLLCQAHATLGRYWGWVQ